KAALAQNAKNLRAAARAVQRAGDNGAQAREEGFELAQWALQTGAAEAVAPISARLAKGAGSLAGPVAEQPELVGRLQGQGKRLLAAIGKADPKAEASSHVDIAALDARLAAIDARMGTEFPEYAELSNPRPLTLAAVQSLLGADEALVAFLDVKRPQVGNLPE